MHQEKEVNINVYYDKPDATSERVINARIPIFRLL